MTLHYIILYHVMLFYSILFYSIILYKAALQLRPGLEVVHRAPAEPLGEGRMM